MTVTHTHTIISPLPDGLITAGVVAGGAALLGAMAVGAAALIGLGIAKAAGK